MSDLRTHGSDSTCHKSKLKLGRLLLPPLSWHCPHRMVLVDWTWLWRTCNICNNECTAQTRLMTNGQTKAGSLLHSFCNWTTQCLWFGRIPVFSSKVHLNAQKVPASGQLSRQVIQSKQQKALKDQIVKYQSLWHLPLGHSQWNNCLSSPRNVKVPWWAVTRSFFCYNSCPCTRMTSPYIMI